jgi:hypothetical protein
MNRVKLSTSPSILIAFVKRGLWNFDIILNSDFSTLFICELAEKIWKIRLRNRSTLCSNLCKNLLK